MLVRARPSGHLGSGHPFVELCAATGGVTGRKDALAAGPADRLPAEDMSADVQRSAFAAKSLSVREMVALLGAHTVRSLSTET